MAQHQSRSLTWAVAGYGNVVGRRVLSAIRQNGGEVMAVWGRNGRRAAEFAARHRISRGTGALDRLFGDVDAVYVATPVVTHVPIAIAALEAGCHVLIEKPLAGRCDADVARLLSLARGHNLRAGVAYYRRTTAGFQFLRETLRNATGVEASIIFRTRFDPEPSDPMYWRTDLALSGGGVLSDAGCHRLDLLCALFGRPTAMSGRLSDPFPLGAERKATLSMAWASGAQATCDFEWSERRSEDSMAIGFDGGEIVVDPLDGWSISWRDAHGWHHAEFGVQSNPLVELVRDFQRCCLTGSAPICTLEQAILVDDIIRSCACPVTES